MRPLGRRPVKFPGKTDCHPKRPLVNWWEVIVDEDNKSDRQKGKYEIRKEICAWGSKQNGSSTK